MLTIRGKALGRKRPLFADWSIPFPPDLGDGGSLTLRDLIGRVVRAEVEAFQKRQQERRLFRALTEKQIQEGAGRGKIEAGGSDLNQKVDADEAVATALEAFEDGLYLVINGAGVSGKPGRAKGGTCQKRSANALLRTVDTRFRGCETCALSRIDNYRVEKSHVLIEGHLGRYSIHLGSAVVHRMPGGSVCIVPVYAQQRGRLFLPFADEDPRAAEVLSKVILLARDQEIQDPSILEQLR